MGRINEELTGDYFLGGADSSTGPENSVLGHTELKPGEFEPRRREEFEFTSTFAGELEGKDVLEIGFGSNDRIPFFVNAGVQSYHVIDFSPSALTPIPARCFFANVTLQHLNFRDLKTDLTFDLVVFYDIIENIPAFEMEVIWRKIRKMLRPGGVIVFSTTTYDNPNEPDRTEISFTEMGVPCHKQTIGTIIRTCLYQGFLIGRNTTRCFGLCRTTDLPNLPDERRVAFAANHSALMRSQGLKFGIGQHLTLDEIRSVIPGAGRLLIGCVADSHPKYLAQALRLVQSIRWLGGGMAGANIMVCLIDKADPEYVNELIKWGVFVRVLPKFSYFHANANKLRLFDVPELFAYDTVVLLDCDTIVVQDPMPYLDGKAFQGKIVDGATVSYETFKALFGHFGLSLPKQQYRTTYTQVPTIWYCNSGVLVFPRNLIDLLVPLWRRYASDLAENIHLMEGADFFCEQSSLALAFAKASESCELPYLPLPSAMNYPLHRALDNAPEEMLNCEPAIIHYHDLVDSDGYICPVPLPCVQQRVTAFNERLRSHRNKQTEVKEGARRRHKDENDK